MRGVLGGVWGGAVLCDDRPQQLAAKTLLYKILNAKTGLEKQVLGHKKQVLET